MRQLDVNFDFSIAQERGRGVLNMRKIQYELIVEGSGHKATRCEF